MFGAVRCSAWPQETGPAGPLVLSTLDGDLASSRSNPAARVHAVTMSREHEIGSPADLPPGTLTAPDPTP
jgi:hypothetical protein